MCKSSCSHGFPVCAKSQAGKTRACSGCLHRQAVHYRKRTLSLESHHFHSKLKQVGSLGKDLISTLKSEHLETDSCSDVWVRRRQTFLARTYRTFRTIGNGVSHHSCPKQLQICGTSALSYRCSVRSCVLPLVMLSLFYCPKTLPPRKASFSIDLCRDPFPHEALLFLPISSSRRCFSCILKWAQNSHILSFLGVYI